MGRKQARTREQERGLMPPASIKGADCGGNRSLPERRIRMMIKARMAKVLRGCEKRQR